MSPPPNPLLMKPQSSYTINVSYNLLEDSWRFAVLVRLKNKPSSKTDDTFTYPCVKLPRKDILI